MAKLSFCPICFLLRDLLDQGRREEARKLIIEQSRRGFHSKEFVRLVVDEFVEMKKRGKGAPRKKLPPKFYEIGKDYEELVEALKPKTYEQAIDILAERYSAGRNRIKSTVARFIKASRTTRR